MEDATVDVAVSAVVSLAVAAQAHAERAGCPHCASRKLQRWGHASGLPRYRCGDCRRTFNALTGTPLARLRMKDRWADQAQALITGESVVKAATRCGVAVTTAFRWRHRFLSAPAIDKPSQLTGIVQGKARRPVSSGAQARRVGEDQRPVSGADPGPDRA